MAQMVEDLIFTDSFLIKGVIHRKHTRLSKFLDEYPRHFLRIDDASMVDLKSKEKVKTPRVFVNMMEIVFAHEFLDTAGDFFQKTIAKGREAVRIRAFYSGSVNLEFSGRCRPGSYEVEDVTKKFFVMESPHLRGMDLGEDKDLAILKNLPYIVLHKSRLSYIYDFNST